MEGSARISAIFRGVVRDDECCAELGEKRKTITMSAEAECQPERGEGELTTLLDYCHSPDLVNYL